MNSGSSTDVWRVGSAPSNLMSRSPQIVRVRGRVFGVSKTEIAAPIWFGILVWMLLGQEAAVGDVTGHVKAIAITMLLLLLSD